MEIKKTLSNESADKRTYQIGCFLLLVLNPLGERNNSDKTNAVAVVGTQGNFGTDADTFEGRSILGDAFIEVEIGYVVAVIAGNGDEFVVDVTNFAGSLFLGLRTAVGSTEAVVVNAHILYVPNARSVLISVSSYVSGSHAGGGNANSANDGGAS